MLAKRAGRTSSFNIELQFSEQLNFSTDVYYLLDFNYLINYDQCDPNSIETVVYLFDNDYFHEILFESNKINEFETLNNRMWSNQKICFRVLGRSYFLFLKAQSSCSIPNNQAFVAIDNISIYELNESSSYNSCLDIRISEFPETDISKFTTDHELSSPTQNFASQEVTIQKVKFS